MKKKATKKPKIKKGKKPSSKRKVTKNKVKNKPMKKTEQKKSTIKTSENEITEIVCIIDRSTSIRTSNLIERTIEGFNGFLTEQKKQQVGKAKLTLCLFDGGMGFGNTGADGETYEIRHNGIDIKEVPELNTTTFVPKGMTALYDAIGVTIDNVSKRVKEAKAEDRPDKVVFLIMTDGEENSSKEYNQKTVFDAIKKHKEEDKWAFLFIGANIDTMRTGGGMGVSSGNTMSYSNTDHGVRTAYLNVSKSVSNLRSMSASSVNFVETSNNLVVDNGVEKEDLAGNTTTVGANSASGTIGTANRFTTALDENGNGTN